MAITTDLRWITHINNVSSNANRPLNLLDPYPQTQIDKLEMIQRHAARCVLCRHRNVSSVTLDAKKNALYVRVLFCVRLSTCLYTQHVEARQNIGRRKRRCMAFLT